MNGSRAYYASGVTVVQCVLLLITAALGSAQDETPRTWADIAGPRLALDASPADTVMTFAYGEGPNDLHLRYSDDPFEKVVSCYQVEVDGSIWVLPAGGAGCDTLRHFVSVAGRAEQDRAIALRGCFHAFRVRPDGIYFSTLGTRRQPAFYRLSADGNLQKQTILLGWEAEHPPANAGRLVEIRGQLYGCLHGRWVPVGDGAATDTLTHEDVQPGVPGPNGEPIWQAGQIIMRCTEPILDLGDGDRRSVFDTFDGGFVLVRSNVYAGGSLARLLELYDAEGHLVRSVVVPTPAEQYGVGESGPFFITADHVYYLNLDRRRGALLRF